jgi:hypothetical protein
VSRIARPFFVGLLVFGFAHANEFADPPVFGLIAGVVFAMGWPSPEKR